ncbi:MAG: hypothetical protein HWE30_17990 [Methylocystaceae bacterium]|nr:hypothetical protein [Methylocystaceae bacterium]
MSPVLRKVVTGGLLLWMIAGGIYLATIMFAFISTTEIPVSFRQFFCVELEHFTLVLSLSFTLFVGPLYLFRLIRTGPLNIQNPAFRIGLIGLFLCIAFLQFTLLFAVLKTVGAMSYETSQLACWGHYPSDEVVGQNTLTEKLGFLALVFVFAFFPVYLFRRTLKGTV